MIRRFRIFCEKHPYVSVLSFALIVMLLMMVVQDYIMSFFVESNNFDEIKLAVFFVLLGIILYPSLLFIKWFARIKVKNRNGNKKKDHDLS